MIAGYRSRPVQVAEQLLSDYGIKRPPINPGLILLDFPIKVVLEDWGTDVSGIFVRGEVLNHIGLNKNHPVERRHFTLWHEFYHFYEHKSIYFCEFNGRVKASLLEQEADIFAAHFLMPERWVRRYFDQLFGNVGALAKRFTVSKTAMTNRLKALKLMEGAG
ncbi:MAG: ImmA/IrrE family metallo-endopeptidase [Chloroflexi bacterium]|nr:ImmA/IrrE family metallo-endopeptidase [Chloroflexota bacterium]MDA8189303.1 ImmA/IrrE family metallo-endopeptidase [Dehalococcoidales bacterium]